LFGKRDSAEAWEIRDFLKRSVVEFAWIELTADDDRRRELGLPDLNNVRLPAVELPGGKDRFDRDYLFFPKFAPYKLIRLILSRH
jgi:thioredoxin reductase (NADPH)